MTRTILAVLLTATAAHAQGVKPELVLQTEHTANVLTTVFTPGNDKVITCGRDGRALLWEIPSGRLLREFYARAGGCYTAAMSPDSKILVTGHHNGTCIGWELSIGNQLYKVSTMPTFAKIDLVRNNTVFVQFEPSGKRFWAFTRERIYGFDALTGQYAASKNLPDDNDDAAVIPGSRLLWLRSKAGDRDDRVYDISTDKVISRVTAGRNGDVTPVGPGLVSPDGKFYVCCASKNGSDGMPFLSVRDLEKAESRLVSLPVPKTAPRAAVPIPRLLAFRDSTSLLAILPEGGLQLIDLKTGRPRSISSTSPSDSIGWASVSSDGKWAVTADKASATKLRLWDLQEVRFVTQFGGSIAPGWVVVTTSVDGKSIYLAKDSHLTRFSAVSGQVEARWAVSGGDGISAVAHSPKHNRLVVGTGRGHILFLEADNLRLVKSFTTPPSLLSLLPGAEKGYLPVRRVVVDNAERSVLVDCDNVSCQSYLLPDGEPGGDSTDLRSRELLLPDATPDGVTLATVRRFNDPHVTDRPTRYAIEFWRGDKPASDKLLVEKPGIVRWTEDGRHLVYCTSTTATVYDAKTYKYVREVNAHRYIGEELFDRLFQEDLPVVTRLRGDVFLSGGADGRTLIWDAKTGKVVKELTSHGIPICAVGKLPGERLYSAAANGTLSIFDEKAGDRLGTLLADGQDWLVSTPAGLFDGSLGGRERVSFRVGNGLTVVPVDRFFADFYYPGLLAAVMKGERPKPTATFAVQAAPAVRIPSPTDKSSVPADSLEVVVEVTDQGGGVSGLALYHDGIRILAPGDSVKYGKITRRTFKVKLVEGENRFEAKASSGDGGWQSEPARLVVTYNKPLVQPDLYVLAVGVSEYADAGISLKFAATDARKLGDVFERRGKQIYAKANVTYLLDGKATRAGIREALEEIAKKAQPRDTFILTVSGHGTTLGQRYYFLPHEFDGGKFPTTEENVKKQGIPIDELGELLRQVPALKKVLILDTCGSGGATGLLQKGRNPFAFRGEIERLNRAEGVFTIAACAAGEEAQEPKELGHGVLSYALLAGLRAVDKGPLENKGVDTANPKQVVDVLEWFSFAAGQTPGLMKKYFGREQDIHTSGSGTSFPLLPARDK